jgi:hypothetical protein
VPNYDCVMTIIKDLAIVIGILVAGTSLVVHWKAILRPDLKRVEERRFKAVEDLYSFLSDYRFLAVYAGKRGIPSEEVYSILNEKPISPSPFLPEHIEKKLGAFVFKLGWNLLVPVEGAFEDEQDRAEAWKRVKAEMLVAHKEVFLETAKWLGCPEKGFPFPTTLLGQKPAPVGDEKGRAEKT